MEKRGNQPSQGTENPVTRIELPSPFRRQISVLKLNLKDKFGKLMTHAINAAVVAIGTVRVNLATFFALACPRAVLVEVAVIVKVAGSGRVTSAICTTVHVICAVVVVSAEIICLTVPSIAAIEADWAVVIS